MILKFQYNLINEAKWKKIKTIIVCRKCEVGKGKVNRSEVR